MGPPLMHRIRKNVKAMFKRSSKIDDAHLAVEDKETNKSQHSEQSLDDRDKRMALVRRIATSLIGADVLHDGVYGAKPLIYADWTASGRSLSFIEDFIRDCVMPMYANTHTETSATGLQTTMFRREAREMVARSVNATVEDHAVIFCGSGATGAIDKLVGVLNIRIPNDLCDKYDLRSRIPEDERPIVLHGPYEHHSNILPWRESIADVIEVNLDETGMIDLIHLEELVLKYKSRKGLKIGTFSAASNVTGIISKNVEISIILHRHGFLSFWDYAAGGPYLHIDMQLLAAKSLPDGHLAYMDAIFISPHKMPGGPGTPGVLVARRDLFKNTVPVVPGGGTVLFVQTTTHEYSHEIEEREEGGTPAIIESIRAGMVFKLKDSVGADLIHDLEHNFLQRAIESLSMNSNIILLGNPKLERLCILSFVMVRQQRMLHHAFVVALLSDLFGIQARGGCSCAGPYGHQLLDLNIDAELMNLVIEEGMEGTKPGWARINFNYFFSEEMFNYIIKALHMVANFGWKMIPYYSYCPASGKWKHETLSEVRTARHTLHEFDPLNTASSSDSASMGYATRRVDGDMLNEFLKQAQEVLDAADPYVHLAERIENGTFTPPNASDMYDRLRMYVAPEDFMASRKPLGPSIDSNRTASMKNGKSCSRGSCGSGECFDRTKLRSNSSGAHGHSAAAAAAVTAALGESPSSNSKAVVAAAAAAAAAEHAKASPSTTLAKTSKVGAPDAAAQVTRPVSSSLAATIAALKSNTQPAPRQGLGSLRTLHEDA